MPDKPAPKKPPGPKSTGAKVALYGGGAVVLAYVGYRLYEAYEANQANAALTTTTPTTSGSTTIGTPATTTPAYGSLTTLAAWKSAVLDYMVNTLGIKGGANTAAIGLADALSGHCVGPNEYAALNSALGAIGQPPGTGVLTIKQCGKAATNQPTTTHTPSETPHPASPPTTTPSRPRAIPGPSARANAIDAARRRANDLRAAARRRLNDVNAAARRTPHPRPVVVQSHRRP